MSFRVLGTNHTSFTVSNLERSMTIAFNVDDVAAALEAVKHYGVKPVAPPVAIDQGPNKGRRVVYLRDWDGITIELIEASPG